MSHIAVLLDPLNKEEVLGYVLDIFVEGAFVKSKYVKDIAIMLFNEYKEKYGIVGHEGTCGESSNEGSSVVSNPSISSARVLYIKWRSILSEETQSELERYLSEARECESPKFDILLIGK